MKRALIVLTATLALVSTGCSANDGTPSESGTPAGVTADWAKPLTVCKALDVDLLQTLVAPWEAEAEWQTKPDTKRGPSENAIGTVSCTFSYAGSGGHRIEVLITQMDSAESVTDRMTVMRNGECDAIGDIMFVRCSDTPHDWLESWSSSEAVLVHVSGFFWDETNLDRAAYKAKMVELHENAHQLAVSLGL